jgi:hypothetical protein
MWLVAVCACGRFGLETTRGGDASAMTGDGDPNCVAETDATFCARTGKSCEAFTALDNCGATRTADCGTCSAPANACVANVCSVPLCADATGAYKFPATGTVVSSLHVASTQQALLGISADAKSVLFLRGSPQCVTTGATLFIGDDPSGALNYTLHDLSAVGALSTFTKAEETMTLTGDGLTIIGVATSGGLQSTTRGASGMTNFSAPTKTPFATINAALPAGGSVAWPFISRDGLSLSYAVGGATTPSQNGIYQAVRTTTANAFGTPALVAGAVQSYGGLSGISEDGMTAFGATTAYNTAILSRTSTSQAFANATATNPGLAWRVIPTATCTFVVGTCEPGGCMNEDICTWAKQ